MLKRLLRRLLGISEPVSDPVLVRVWDRDWNLLASSDDRNLADIVAFHTPEQVVNVTLDQDYAFGSRHYRLIARIDEQKWTKPA
ncbi:hypothetical protein [Rhodococcoides fascians]|uniref:hypothetical protein n=1 Tax=Rhodococcoides fascians TaxID=1828 RepID=UPI00050CF4FC|nr:hypothetical protein [Rhodococcus fascians]